MYDFITALRTQHSNTIATPDLDNMTDQAVGYILVQFRDCTYSETAYDKIKTALQMTPGDATTAFEYDVELPRDTAAAQAELFTTSLLAPADPAERQALMIGFIDRETIATDELKQRINGIIRANADLIVLYGDCDPTQLPEAVSATLRQAQTAQILIVLVAPSVQV